MDDIKGNPPVDGGNGSASVKVSKQDSRDEQPMMTRLVPDPAMSPLTGADLGAGKTSDDDLGAAADVADAKRMARCRPK
ncbi:hypothetical protein [Qipengyuania sediminis]|uniref:hypothetical protein n=1 Tax=Qipengyuania sediminis TaxID=1532023 RepID=UPI0010593441|nr:hypothetical protein [Qipengyuania sediminis]